MAKKKTEVLVVAPAKFREIQLKIIGTAPYCQNAFSNKVMGDIINNQEAGSSGRSSKKRDPKDFDKLCEQALHRSKDGWIGIPASAFRNAMISACRAAGIVMTHAKLAVFVEADGYDKHSMDALVRIYGDYARQDAAVRIASGAIDIRPRPVWPPGWHATIRIVFDADMISAQNVFNLLERAGMQVGIGEGRPDSKKSAGMGWGLFRISREEDNEQ